MKTDDFREELEALLTKYVGDFVDDVEMPVIQEFVLIVAIDDVADIRAGGHCVQTRKGTHTYRTKGMLLHALDMIRESGEEE